MNTTMIEALIRTMITISYGCICAYFGYMIGITNRRK